MAEAYALLGGWKAAKDAYRADLANAANSLLAGPSPPMLGVFVGKPRAYGGIYPAWLLFRLTARGQCSWADRFMPAEMMAQILVLYPTTSPGGSNLSGRAYAEEVTEEAASSWIDRLWELGAMERFTGGFEVSSEAMGSEDEFGRTMFQDSRNNALWATSLEVVGRL